MPGIVGIQQQQNTGQSNRSGIPAPTQVPKSGGFKPCTLTWYDPALGGINSSNGQANPNALMANGKPYNPNAYTCAADPSFAFGTKLDIRIGDKEVVVTVTDRGGAITGNHFDLSRAAARDLGILNSGTAQGQYLVTNLPAGAKHSPVNSAVDTVSGAVGSVGNTLGDIGKAIGFIFSLQFLYIVAGGVLLVVALVFLLMHSNTGKQVVSNLPLPVE